MSLDKTKERPILFRGSMVRALLDGSKTQTRRVVKHAEFQVSETAGYDWQFRCKRMLWQDQTEAQMMARCPYGQPGDRLWVRERVRVLECGEVDYFADGREIWERMQDHIDLPDAAKWKPSIHMPRLASRITLEITGVRVERLQDISVADALAEGITLHPYHHNRPHNSRYGAVATYQAFWEPINGDESWDANPWVWVVKFKVVKP